ncbi:hypothetical protein EYC84_004644 [Monilinia fructicola]|uniref:Uncharacterized protein n=1 Tax=Monilinia fructicola TaxID=38448 RepID=A0A5M9K1U2_MONFR|nr:hypothetical protein EYC84_004644 [Monilinia fructicola]
MKHISSHLGYSKNNSTQPLQREFFTTSPIPIHVNTTRIIHYNKPKNNRQQPHRSRYYTTLHYTTPHRTAPPTHRDQGQDIKDQSPASKKGGPLPSPPAKKPEDKCLNFFANQMDILCEKPKEKTV